MPSISAALQRKQAALDSSLRSMGRLLVAYSGGTDSAYLAYAAHQALGQRMLAVIADSPSLSRSHLRDAMRFSEEANIPLRVVSTHELNNPDYLKNDSTRCFHCKDELFKVMGDLAGQMEFQTIAYGMNLDDIGEFRPGQIAARQHRVAAPLAEAQLTKQEIRLLAHDAGLRIWDKPASACLSSRIAYGVPVTEATLVSIEKGEELLRAMGFRQFRVRHHGEMVRLEIARDEIERMFSLDVFDRLTAELKALGYQYVTLDLEGYRSGSMNAVLPISEIGRMTSNSVSQRVRPE